VLVGEQPGDQEDLDGRPFVGPAGQLLDRALAAAGIDRTRCWVTNTVKHFKWEPRGRRRIHQTPTARDVAACRPWLDAELAILRPRLLVCLGATAARAVYGPAARVTRDRGVVRPSPLAPHTLITIHPSALLRAPDEATQREEYARFLADLQVAARFIGAAGPSAPNLT
jgi:DNA polymerase